MIYSGLLLFGFLLILWWLWRTTMRWFEANGHDIWGNPWFHRLDGANRLFCRLYHRLQHDPITLPKTGGAVLVANHISGLDPLLLGAATDRPLHFLVAREEYERFGTRWFFRGAHSIPVDRSTKPARAFRAALAALSRGEVIAVFPHGGIVQPGGPEKPLKSGALRMAQLAGVLDTQECLQILAALFRGRPEDVDCPGYDPLATTKAG